MKYVCPICKESHVYVKTWVNMNTRFVETLGESTDEEDYWCANCEAKIIPVVVSGVSDD